MRKRILRIRQIGQSRLLLQWQAILDLILNPSIKPVNMANWQLRKQELPAGLDIVSTQAPPAPRRSQVAFYSFAWSAIPIGAAMATC
jgi:hypothetical protein